MFVCWFVVFLSLKCVNKLFVVCVGFFLLCNLVMSKIFFCFVKSLFIVVNCLVRLICFCIFFGFVFILKLEIVVSLLFVFKRVVKIWMVVVLFVLFEFSNVKILLCFILKFIFFKIFVFLNDFFKFVVLIIIFFIWI